MKYAVIVNSATGNTAQVADAVQQRLAAKGEVNLVTLSPATVAEARDAVLAADAVAVGFWCDKGSCTPVVDDLLAATAGKRVFLFGTAGFGGSPEYFDRILAGVAAKLPESADYAGGAMCQGRMGEGILRRYEAMLAEHPGDAKAQAMIENYHSAVSHPDEDDVVRIADAAERALA